jgi:hypothetical protein
MPKAKQTYTTGIDQDTSKLKYKNTSYFEAYNFRVITDGGSSTGSLENEKGNKLSFKIPSTTASYKIRRINNANAAGSETITINGNAINYTAVDGILTTAQLFQIIADDPNVQLLISTNGIKLVEDEDFVYLIGLNVTLVVSVAGTDCKLTNIAQAQSELKICGMGHLDQWIIVFTTSETTANPASSIGDQIWKLKYDEYANVIEGLSSGFLVPSTHLIYNNQLNLSTYHRIEEPITRYETTKIGRVYFTDFNNPLRSINIFDDNLWILPPGNLDVVANVNLSKPIIQSLSTGSIPAGSVLQYAYRLINQTQGNSTIFSPASTLVTLTKNDSSSTIHNDTFFGADSTGTPSSSVSYRIENIDTDYDIIEHYYIYWSSPNNPTVYKFGEDFVPPSGNIDVIHAGTETALPITTLEYNALTNSLVAKTLTSKDDRLVAANIKEPTFEIDFDARAYRAKESAISPGSGDTSFDLYNSDGTSNSYNTGNWDTISEEHDAINPYNQEDPELNNKDYPTWLVDDGYKYAPGESYLGGKGPNVKYKFVIQNYSANDLYAVPNPAYTPFSQVSRYLSGDPPLTLNEKNLDNSNIEYPRAGEIKNMASAKINGVLRGYSRGEVYRFGVTFYDLKGNPSFVKWIGDIKFPEMYETTDDATSGINNTYKLMSFRSTSNVSDLHTLGIEFTIDVSDIVDKISGFSIVRVERTEVNKTRLGTGLSMHFNKDDYNNNGAGGVFVNFTDETSVTSSSIKIDGTGENIVNLMDRPGFTPWHNNLSSGKTKGLSVFCSPLGQFRANNNYAFKARDHIQTIGYYNAYADRFYFDDPDDSIGIWYKMRDYFIPTPIPLSFPTDYRAGNQKMLIDHEVQMTGGQVLDGNSSIFDNVSIGSSSDSYLINASYAKGGKNTPLGLGNYKQLLILNTNASASDWWDGALNPLTAAVPSGPRKGIWYDGGAIINEGEQVVNNTSSNDQSDNVLIFKEVSYNRFLIKQYGGNSYLDRNKSIYMSTNHFQAVSEVSNVGNTELTFKVFGGDTYVNFYDEEYITQHWNSDGLSYESPEAKDGKMAIGLMYPCETSANTELRYGNHFSKDRDPANMLDYQFEDYKMLTFYNQENNIKSQFFAKDALVDLLEEQRFTIKVSNAKVDGELLDNWKVFLPNNELPVEGIHGQINKIVNLKGNVFFYQDSAIGTAAINDRVTQVSESGVEIVLGTGEVISDYSYMSTETGTIHQYSVITSGNSLYHYDDRLKKMFRLGGGGVEPISDIKGLSAFLGKIDGSLEENDITLQNLGVHGIYDRRHNRAIMTFLNYKIYPGVEGNKEYEVGDIVFFAGLYYEVITAFTAPAIPQTPSTDPNFQALVDKDGNPIFINGFTVSYNEILNAFESFLDYKPNIYLHTGRRLLSVNSFTNEREIYEHDTGDYGQFYGAYHNSKITLILAPGADIIKVFDNIEYNAEISINDLDAPNEALKQMRFYNDYQDTGIIPLTLGDTVVRRMRKFRSTIPRDAKDAAASPKPRMRDAYIFLELEFENNLDNKRLVLHDIGLSFRSANM